MAVDARRVGRGEDLLGREVRHVRDAVGGREARGLPRGARQQADGQVGARTGVVQRVEAALGQPAGDGDERVGARASRRRPGPPRPGAGRAAAAPRAWPARRRARGRGGRARAHAGVGPGRIVQLISRRLTTSPVSRIAGRRSRPERTGSRSSSRPGRDGARERDRGAALAADARGSARRTTAARTRACRRPRARSARA